MDLRTARPDDVGAIVALVESAYRGDASRAGWTTEADLLQGQRTDAAAALQQIADPDGEMLLLHDDGALVACCHLRRQGSGAYFGSFAVSPGQQGRGIGRQLLAAAEARAVERWDADVLEMTVIARRTELVAWYARRGYAPTGERRPFPYGDERFGIPQVDDLDFAVLVRSLRA